MEHTDDGIFGLEISEALHCKNISLVDGLCPNKSICAFCDVIHTILETLPLNRTVTKDCSIVTNKNTISEFLDLRLTVRPFTFRDSVYSLILVKDITIHQSRAILDNFFLHDIINSVNSLKGFTDFFINNHTRLLSNEYIFLLHKMNNELLEKIVSHQALVLTENNDLQVKFTTLSTLHIIKETVSYLSYELVSQSKKILIDKRTLILSFSSSEVLLKHVLIGMIKMALETCAEKAYLVINCHKEGDDIVFTCNNQRFKPYTLKDQSYWAPNQVTWKATFMPHELQSILFKRNSLPNKLATRSLEYSIKLLTEKYLRGTMGAAITKNTNPIYFLKIPQLLVSTGY